MSEDDKTKAAQKVYDSVMRAFPGLNKFMIQSQAYAHKYGYVETILGRRRHLTDMQLEDFEFKPLPGYVNPNVDPLDLSTLSGEAGIPEDYVNKLTSEFSKYKYFGQIAKRTKELYDKEHIKVVNNRMKKNDAKRQCVNCVDFDTEILTLEGWKNYNEISKGDAILAYDEKTNKIVKDSIVDITISNERTDVMHLHNQHFDAVCTMNHRWVMRNFDTNQVRVFTTEHIKRFHRPRYHILRVAGSEFSADARYSHGIVKTLAEGIMGGVYSYLEIIQFGSEVCKQIYEYIKNNIAVKGAVIVLSKDVADKLQYLSMLAGFTANIFVTTKLMKRVNKEITTYRVSMPKRVMYETARIDLMKKDEIEVDGVWCPTTNTGTWIARRNGKPYITGNSIIQGSAADFTKMALINVSTDKRWKYLGGQILTVVHDEIIAQVPIYAYEEASKVLQEDMEKAGKFLPFPINCDTEITYRWYGLEAPCKYPKPESMEAAWSEDNLKWVQYHLVEMEYELPIFKDADGNKPIGDAAHGISGQYSTEYANAIEDYCKRYNVAKDKFLDDIEQRVQYGLVER